MESKYQPQPGDTITHRDPPERASWEPYRVISRHPDTHDDFIAIDTDGDVHSLFDEDDWVNVENEPATQATGDRPDRPYVIVRQGQSGVWAGEATHVSTDRVELPAGRRIRYFKGAVDCSDIAVNGVTDPDETVMTPATHVIVHRPDETHFATDKARDCLSAVKVRSEHT